MGNHFVPQFYLHGFTSDKTIWAHDKLKKCSFPSEPKSIANETGMYSDELENYFTIQVEQPAEDAIRKIRLQQSLSSGDRNALAKYMAALWKRGPKGRNRVVDRLPEVASTVQKDLHDRIDALSIIDPNLHDWADAKKAQVAEIIQRNVDQNSTELWQKLLFSEATPKIIEAMESMNWQFLVADGQSYLTSDNPLFFFSEEGIGPPHAEVTIPFSSNVSLWMNRDPTLKPLYAPATGTYVKEINRRTVHNAVRFAFSATNDSWMLNFVCKPKHQLSHLPW
jgi:hypothetical protein